MNASISEPGRLRRELALPGAVVIGLGSMFGTGVFVGMGTAAELVGPAVVLAIALAGLIALCNALGGAQLAAAYPVSGGSYEFGYQLLNPTLGFTAGWLFICAKAASAATAARGFAGYFLASLNVDSSIAMTLISIAVVVILTITAASGLRRSNAVNALIVSVTIGSLMLFCLVCGRAELDTARESFSPFLQTQGRNGLAALLEATALMFVAFTGYGRIATMGEEVREPARTIPRAIAVTMAITFVLYAAVAAVAIAAVGGSELGEAVRESAAPLELAADRMGPPWLATVVSFGAMAAMLGVLLNLILGVSRVMLAMGRRGDLPPIVARVNQARSSPVAAVVVTGAVILGLCMIGDVTTTWSFSAFTVLIYYAVTNLAALRLAPVQRKYPRWIAWTGLAACLGLAFWVPWRVWAAGLAIIGIGLIWRRVFHAAKAGAGREV